MRFTGSRARLLAACKYSFRDDVSHREWPATDEQGFGNALHEAADRHIKQEPVALSFLAGKWRVPERDFERLERVWGHMKAWLAEGEGQGVPWMTEIKLALDLVNRRARILFEMGPRDYSGCLPGEVPMTLDILYPVEGGRPVVWDWKTGHKADGYWPQIGLQVLAAAWLFGEDSVQGGILHATENGVDASRVRVFDALDIAAIADDLASDLAAVADSSPRAGEHCTELRCGAFGLCPETLAAVEGVVALVPAERLSSGPHKLSLAFDSADHAAWALQQIRVYDSYADQVKKAVRYFVGQAEHPVVGGVLKETFRNVPRLSVPDLVALARSKGANDAEIAGCSRMNTESAGVRVVKKLAV